MKYIVIKSNTIEHLKAEFGEETVVECLNLAKQDHPQKIYESLQETNKKISSCFFQIFKELIS